MKLEACNHIIIYFIGILVLIYSRHVGKRAQSFFAPCWIILDHTFHVWIWSHSAFISRTVLGYSRFVVYLPSDNLRNSSWLFPCCRHCLLQSLRSCLFWARPDFALMDLHNFANCVLSFRMICWMFIILWLTYCNVFIFLSSCVSASETILVITESVSLVISTSWCGYHYGCSSQSLGILLSGFWVTFILVRIYMEGCNSHTGASGSCVSAT